MQLLMNLLMNIIGRLLHLIHFIWKGLLTGLRFADDTVDNTNKHGMTSTLFFFYSKKRLSFLLRNTNGHHNFLIHLPMIIQLIQQIHRKQNNNFSSSIIHPPSNQRIQTPPHIINDFNIPQHSQWMPWNEQSYT